MDYQAILEYLTEDKVKSILEKLKIPYHDHGGYLTMPTYCHNSMTEEASEKLYYYKNNKIFMCFTEDGVMPIFKFLKNFYEAQGMQWDWYRDIYNLIVDDNFQNQFEYTTERYHSLTADFSKSTPRELPIVPKGILNIFTKYYPIEWLSDNITKEAMDKFNILYSSTQNRIIIPHYNPDGNLIGIRSRALNQNDIEQFGKYMPVQIEGKWYSHPLSLNLYGLYENKENIKNSGICFVFEAE